MTRSARLHSNGPLTTIHQDRPGWIVISMEFDRPGSCVLGHAHAFDHWMEVKVGALVVFSPEHNLVKAGERMLVPAHVKHELMSLKSGTIAECQHQIRKENGTIDPYNFNPDGIPAEWVTRLIEDGDHFSQVIHAG